MCSLRNAVTLAHSPEIIIQMISLGNWPLQEFLMGVETPIPPKMINPAAPGGAPPRRISKVREKILASFV